MATHSRTRAWKIPWTEEPGGLQSMGSLWVWHDWATSFTFHSPALEKEMAIHSCSCLENPRDGGAWWAAVYGVAQSRTRLKRLSSSSSNIPQCLTHKCHTLPAFTHTVPPTGEHFLFPTCQLCWLTLLDPVFRTGHIHADLSCHPRCPHLYKAQTFIMTAHRHLHACLF